MSYTMAVGFPVLVTVTKDANTPRLPTFRDKVKARKMEVEIKGARELVADADAARFGAQGSPTWVHRVLIPSAEYRKGRIFADSVDEAVSEIVAEVFKPFHR
jgi:electron transfer flavoprotein beta subunit